MRWAILIHQGNRVEVKADFKGTYEEALARANQFDKELTEEQKSECWRHSVEDEPLDQVSPSIGRT